jgi:hypothetical protein
LRETAGVGQGRKFLQINSENRLNPDREVNSPALEFVGGEKIAELTQPLRFAVKLIKNVATEATFDF